VSEPKVTEAEYQEALRRRLGSCLEVRLWRQLVGNFWTKYGDSDFRPIKAGPPKGAADLSGLVLSSGKRLEIEIKGPDGRLSKEQEQFRKNMLDWNAVHMVCFYDKGLSLEENVEREFREMQRLIGESR